MNKKYFLLISILYWSCSNDSILSPPNGVGEDAFEFSLEDVNPQSITFGQVISHSFFDGYIRLYYFPSSDT